MSETRFTPGPWEAVTKDDPRGQPVGYYPGLVAILSGEPHLSVVAHPEGRHTSPEEWEPNAHLIAAAPDLLAVVLELVRLDPDIPETLFGKAAMALAKARGETP